MSQPEIATDYEKTSALAQEIEALKEKRGGAYCRVDGAK